MSGPQAANKRLVSNPRTPLQVNCRTASCFSLFSKLPAEIRLIIYKEANTVERVLRLDLGIDNPPTLLHVCYESRVETQKQFTMHQGIIHCDGSDPGTMQTPEARYRVWINKNGRNILHLTPLYRPSFPAGQSLPFEYLEDYEDQSFANVNSSAFSELTSVKPEGNMKFENLSRIMVETGCSQRRDQNPLDEEDEVLDWGDIYAGLTVRYNSGNVGDRLGIGFSEMIVVWKEHKFDASRIELQDLEARALCVMPSEKALQPHCDKDDCDQKPHHCFVYDEGFIFPLADLSHDEKYAMNLIAESFVGVMGGYHDAVLDRQVDPVEPKWPCVILLGNKPMSSAEERLVRILSEECLETKVQ